MTRPSRGIFSPFTNAIPLIVAWGANRKVAWINASRCVTQMHDVHSDWRAGCVCNGPSNTVRGFFVCFSSGHHSVAATSTATVPNQTITNAIYSFRKPALCRFNQAWAGKKLFPIHCAASDLSTARSSKARTWPAKLRWFCLASSRSRRSNSRPKPPTVMHTLFVLVFAPFVAVIGDVCRIIGLWGQHPISIFFAFFYRLDEGAIDHAPQI